MNTKIRSVKFNFIMNLILTVSSFIFPLITYPYISRVLLVDGNGEVSFAASVLSYFSMFASLGIPTYGIKICAQVRNNKEELSRTVQELLIINIFSMIVTYIAFFWSLFMIPAFSADKGLLLINSISLLLNTLGVNWFYSALEQYSYITIRSLIFKILSMAFMFLLVHRQNDYLIYAAITVLATGGSNVLNFINLRKYVILKPVGNYNIKKHLKPVFIFFGSAVASSIYINLDMVMLGFIAGKTQVGYYQVAVKVKLLLTSLVTSLGTVLMPRLSYYIQIGKDKEFKDIIIKSFNFIIILASSISVYFIIFARETVLVLSGEAFLGSVLPLQLIMPSVLFIGISYITCYQMLTPLSQEKSMLNSYIIASIFNFILNLIVLPKWRASGAAFSTSVAELTVVLVQCFYLMPILKKIAGRFSFIKAGISLLLSSTLILVIRYCIQTYLSISDFLVLVITSIIFFGMDFVFLLVMKEPFVYKTVLPTIRNVYMKVKHNS